MIDRHDSLTADLPGIPPAPPVLFELQTHAQRRVSLAYVGPRDAARPMCVNCHSCIGDVDTHRGVEYLRCAIAGFSVQRGAICSKYQTAAC